MINLVGGVGWSGVEWGGWSEVGGVGALVGEYKL